MEGYGERSIRQAVIGSVKEMFPVRREPLWLGPQRFKNRQGSVFRGLKNHFSYEPWLPTRIPQSEAGNMVSLSSTPPPISAKTWD